MPRNYLFAIGWTLLILAGCSIPGDNIPDISFDLFEEDKLVHFSFFSIFAWLWSKALPDGFSGKLSVVGITGIAYGIATELYQGMLPWDRTPDPMDAVANIIGLLTGILVYEWRS